jgi:hypothetical protein
MPHRRLLVFLLLFLVPLGARAERSPVEQAERLCKLAMEDFDSLEFDSARQTLQNAITKLRDADEAESAAAAACHINLGIVFVAGFKDRQRGIQQFANALKIDPTLRLDSARATPELQSAFDAAVKQVAAEPRPKRREAGGEPGIEHSPIDEALAGADITIQAQLKNGVQAAKMLVFYRTGHKEFTSVPMKREEETGAWKARIPGASVSGRSVQYYIEARDAQDRPIVDAGSPASPYIISIDGTTPRKPTPAAPTPAPTQLPPSASSSAPSPPKPARPEPVRESLPARGFWRLYADAGIGFGFGVEPIGNHSDVAFQRQNDASYVPVTVKVGGALFAPFHLTAGFGVRLTRAISLGILGRFQVVTTANAGTDVYPPHPTAVAGLIRFRYQWDRGRIKPYLHADVGAGRIRHAFDISSLNTGPDALRGNDNGSGTSVCQPNRRCVDTIATGLLQVGGGAGLWYDLFYFNRGSFNLLFDFNTLVGVGVLPKVTTAATNLNDNPTAVNFDFQIGVGVNFL